MAWCDTLALTPHCSNSSTAAVVAGTHGSEPDEAGGEALWEAPAAYMQIVS